jgi:ABC-type Na+ efflux pump permease subunit
MFGGGTWPVVQRELRAAARWPLGRWLRVGGALGGVMVLCSVWTDVSVAALGTELFDRVHTLLLYLICALVPALAADSLARERREGTLGLLFLTPLTAAGIVLGKTLAQVLRALTVWLAVAPVLTIPFLTGGVTWADVFSFLVIELCVGFLCLAAGILASSLTDNRAIAFILAFLLMAAFVAGPNHYQGWMMPKGARMSTWRTLSAGPGSPTVFMPATIGGWTKITYGSAGFTVTTSRGIPFLRHRPATILAEDFAVASLVLLAALRFAGWCVERSWQDKIPSIRQRSWVRRYCTPVFKRWFARGMRRTLEWNAIAWLQQYSWKARLSKWGLCLLFVVLECVVIDGNDPDALDSLLTALFLVLAAAYTYAGINGFLREKKSGALELILVSPLSVRQIIFGRVWGLWKQFLPSAMLLLASDIAVHVLVPQGSILSHGQWLSIKNWIWVKDFEIVAIYLTLPILATYCALQFKSLFAGAALTVTVMFGPAAWLFSLDYLIQTFSDVLGACIVIAFGYVLLAKSVLWLLRQNLHRRSYFY